MATQPKPTFFFYDLETSGLDPKTHRIMQFAGQRTDMELNPIGEPVNMYVALNDDVLPSPEAIMVTGITPQKTLEEGYTEAEFCQILSEEICTANTIIVGFNNVRFDDEFLRYTLYRNMYDPYEWSWADGRSRWDILDLVRITRALRPEGIEWPVDEKGTPTNRLELLTKVNGLDHEHAHDALNDVLALISITRLIKTKQAKLFDYMLGIRGKNAVQQLVNLENPQPFVYASGRYPNDYQKTTVAYPLAASSKPGAVLVYDLRTDPTPYVAATPKALAATMFADWETRQQKDFVPLPVKELSYNKCPAVAPMGVLNETAQQNIGVDLKGIQHNLAKLQAMKGFGANVQAAFAMREPFNPSQDVDAQLYDGFIGGGDKAALSAVRAASQQELAEFQPKFSDKRLPELLLRYKARNFATSLSETEQTRWEHYRAERLKKDLPGFVKSLQQLAKGETKEDKLFLLSELQLWAESIMPVED